MRLAAILLMVVNLQAASIPPATMKASTEAFLGTPSAFACQYNGPFCAGYFTGEAMALPVPDPKLYQNYQSWWMAAIYPLLPPVIVYPPLASRLIGNKPALAIDAHAVGIVSAIDDASLWIWAHYPGGCGTVVCDPVKPVVRRNFDLTGKVVKKTGKTAYRAARVIL